jgi:hypothetical protein
VIELDESSTRVLSALVDGYRAREGMKPRSRSLSEYELARRLGITQYSYAGFDETQERFELRRALDLLVRMGLATRAGPSGRYDTFAPVANLEQVPTPHEAAAESDEAADALLRQISRQLDEMLSLLRSIDRKLGPD